MKHHKLKHFNPVDTSGLDAVAAISSDSNTTQELTVLICRAGVSRGRGVYITPPPCPILALQEVPSSSRKEELFLLFFELTRFLDRPSALHLRNRLLHPL